jgi:DNA ligase-1
MVNNPNQVMLAGKVTDVNKLKYPLLASIKLDGVRSFIRNAGACGSRKYRADGVVLSRKLKPIPNVFVQELFHNLPDGTDGELILGDPAAKDCYRKTTSATMGRDNPEGKNVTYHVFDKMVDRPFTERYIIVKAEWWLHKKQVRIVEQVTINSAEELLELEAKALAQGHEGLMVRSLDGPYKHGRSTEREGILLKLKRFVDSEAVVESYVPFMHNENEAMTDELGHTKRSTAKEGKVALEMLGKLIGHDVKTGMEVECGTGFTHEERRHLWIFRDKMIKDRWLFKYKYFPTGGKDKPRFPVFIGWRDPIDT